LVVAVAFATVVQVPVALVKAPNAAYPQLTFASTV
jgi:hypothetical protein